MGHCDADPAYLQLSQIVNGISCLALLLAGVISLQASSFSDELCDLASAATVVNGLFGFLAHMLPLRLLEEADTISMLIASLLLFKGMVRAVFPIINNFQYTRTLINMLVVFAIFAAACWTSFNVPAD